MVQRSLFPFSLPQQLFRFSIFCFTLLTSHLSSLTSGLYSTWVRVLSHAGSSISSGFKATWRPPTPSAQLPGDCLPRSSSQAPLVLQTLGRVLRLSLPRPLLLLTHRTRHRHLVWPRALPRCACSSSLPSCCRTLRGQQPFAPCSQRPRSGVLSPCLLFLRRCLLVVVRPTSGNGQCSRVLLLLRVAFSWCIGRGVRATEGDYPAAKGGSLVAKAANLSFFGSYAARTCHNRPKMYARTPFAMRGVVLCRKSTKICPLDMKI